VIKLLLYVRAADYFRLFLEIALVVFLVYFSIKICLEVSNDILLSMSNAKINLLLSSKMAFASKSGVLFGYLSDPWNAVDILNLLVCTSQLLIV